MKADGDVVTEESVQKLRTFVESNVAVSKLSAVAKLIDDPFQKEMKRIMSEFGECKSGPLKKVDRCVSKLENDYQSARFPKASKLLDMVRCSVSFNTVSQLMTGYDGFMEYLQKQSTPMTVARIKNGFLDDEWSGYRDIKINVIF